MPARRAQPGSCSGVLALMVIFCSGPISHPYGAGGPATGRAAGRSPESEGWGEAALSSLGGQHHPRARPERMAVHGQHCGRGSPTSAHVQGASGPSSAAHRSRTPEAHRRCVPHTPHPRSCYQCCSLSSCTNKDTSAAQVSSSTSKCSPSTVSVKSEWGLGSSRSPLPARQSSAVHLSRRGDQRW